MNFCKYKNLFGAANTGAHSIRIPFTDTAFIDLLFTLIVSFITFSLYDDMNYTTHVAIWILIGVFMHWLFCVYK